MGTLRGCGHQLAGAIFNFIGYVVLTVPLAVVLMFVVKVGALGRYISQYITYRSLYLVL